jgi:hypothetical protein
VRTGRTPNKKLSEYAKKRLRVGGRFTKESDN